LPQDIFDLRYLATADDHVAIARGARFSLAGQSELGKETIRFDGKGIGQMRQKWPAQAGHFFMGDLLAEG
jgi:hypothetical protein